MNHPGSDCEGGAAAQRYGGFRLGALHLALPMHALREVVACEQLIALPCAAAGVIGGVNLRGVVVPVLDLRLVLAIPTGTPADACAIIMVHEGRLLGLLAHGVTGVFAAAREQSSDLSVGGPGDLMFSHCIQSEDGIMFSVLSAAALARLPQVPMTADPERLRRVAQDTACDAAEAVPVAHEAVPMLLVRCGRLSMAIGAVDVHSTLSDPTIEDSALARGPCLGVVSVSGNMVPAVDLLAFVGLGALDSGGPRQAFVVQLGTGAVAFLVDAVVDIVRVPPGDVVALPRFALPRPELFAGALPRDVCATRSAAPGADAMPFLVLDSTALRTRDELVAWADVSTRPSAGNAAAVRDAHPTPRDGCGPGRDMLTYDLDVETATPLEQIHEILSFTADMAVFDPHDPMLGVLINRGRSIPMLCLGQLSAGRRTSAGVSASVLVVESGGELVGFVVPGLKSIEPSRWEPRLPAMAAASNPRALALVGSGSSERMLPVLDLHQLARTVQSRALRSAPEHAMA